MVPMNIETLYYLSYLQSHGSLVHWDTILFELFAVTWFPWTLRHYIIWVICSHMVPMYIETLYYLSHLQSHGSLVHWDTILFELFAVTWFPWTLRHYIIRVICSHMVPMNIETLYYSSYLQSHGSHEHWDTILFELFAVTWFPWTLRHYIIWVICSHMVPMYIETLYYLSYLQSHGSHVHWDTILFELFAVTWFPWTLRHYIIRVICSHMVPMNIETLYYSSYLQSHGSHEHWDTILFELFAVTWFPWTLRHYIIRVICSHMVPLYIETLYYSSYLQSHGSHVHWDTILFELFAVTWFPWTLRHYIIRVICSHMVPLYIETLYYLSYLQSHGSHVHWDTILFKLFAVTWFPCTLRHYIIQVICSHMVPMNIETLYYLSYLQSHGSHVHWDTILFELFAVIWFPCTLRHYIIWVICSHMVPMYIETLYYSSYLQSYGSHVHWDTILFKLFAVTWFPCTLRHYIIWVICSHMVPMYIETLYYSSYLQSHGSLVHWDTILFKLFAVTWFPCTLRHYIIWVICSHMVPMYIETLYYSSYLQSHGSLVHWDTILFELFAVTWFPCTLRHYIIQVICSHMVPMYIETLYYLSYLQSHGSHVYWDTILFKLFAVTWFPCTLRHYIIWVICSHMVPLYIETLYYSSYLQSHGSHVHWDTILFESFAVTWFPCILRHYIIQVICSHMVPMYIETLYYLSYLQSHGSLVHWDTILFKLFAVTWFPCILRHYIIRVISSYMVPMFIETLYYLSYLQSHGSHVQWDTILFELFAVIWFPCTLRHDIIWVIWSHMGSMYIETPYIYTVGS